MGDHLDKVPHDWEKSQLGNDTIERTQGIVKNLKGWLNNTNLDVNHISRPEVLHSHSLGIHEMGADMLKMQRAKAKKPNKKPSTHRIPRKKITVDDVEKSEVQIAIDLEWDTTSWSQEEIESGCETLIVVFQDPNSTEAYQEQALKMLSKLFQRHNSAVAFLKRNIEMLLGKAVTRRLHGNRSGGVLPLLKVLNLCIPRFFRDFSIFNTVGRIFEVVLLEAKLAAILIQHYIRCYRSRSRPLQMNPYDEGFGTTSEIERQVRRASNARSAELKRRWRVMHTNNTSSSQQSSNASAYKLLFGARGPVHLPQKYMSVMLEMVSQLVSEEAVTNAPGNREDAARSGGLIVLAGYISAVHGPFASITVRLLSNVAKQPKALYPMVRSGCVSGILKFLRSKRRSGEEKHITELLDCITVITRLGEHAAGLFRARGRYDTITPATSDTEEVNYSTILSELKHDETIHEIQDSISSRALVTELIKTLQESRQMTIVSAVVMCLFTLTCSECYMNVLDELLAIGSRALVRVVQFLEEQVQQVSMPALFLLLQLCAREDCRGGLLTSRLPYMLQNSLLQKANYELPSYRRGCLALVALCRRGNRRAYNPRTLPSSLSKKNDIVNAIYTDLMMTLKCKQADTEQIDIGSLLLMPTVAEAAQFLSTIAYKVGANIICECLCRPDNPCHYNSLPWESAASGVVVMDALTMDLSSASLVLSTASVRYLGHCLYLSFLELSEKTLKESLTTQMLGALNSAVLALSQLCRVGEEDSEKGQDVKNGVDESRVVVAAGFFAMTMANKHPSLNSYPRLKRLQEDLAVRAIDFLRDYATLNLRSGDVAKVSEMAGLVGRDMSELLASLRTVHGYTMYMIYVLDHLCQLIAKLITPATGLEMALLTWKLMQAMLIHLPAPMGHMTTSYKSNSSHIEEGTSSDKILASIASATPTSPLGALPASYFEVLSKVCVVEPGKVVMIGDGYLRRALEKVALLMVSAECSQTDTDNIRQDEVSVVNVKMLVPSSETSKQELKFCLKIIALCANYTSPRLGTANDLVLHTQFGIIRSCLRIIRADSYPRPDDVVLEALHTMHSLSKDSVRISDELDENDVVAVYVHELKRSGSLSSEDVARVHLLTILEIARGLNGTFTSKRLYLLREPVFKVSRLFPSLYSLVHDTLYEMSKHSVPMEKEVLDSLSQAAEAMSSRPRSSVQSSHSHSHSHTRTRTHTHLLNVDVDAGRPGTYTQCGVSHCGRLHENPKSDVGLRDSEGNLGSTVGLSPITRGDSFRFNNKFMMDEEQARLEAEVLSKTKISEGGWQCDISGEIAKEKGLRDAIMRRKFIYGFSDKPVTAEGPKKFDRKSLLKSAPSSIDPRALQPIITRKRGEGNAGKKMEKKVVTRDFTMRAIDISELPEIALTRPPPK